MTVSVIMELLGIPACRMACGLLRSKHHRVTTSSSRGSLTPPFSRAGSCCQHAHPFPAVFVLWVQVARPDNINRGLRTGAKSATPSLDGTAPPCGFPPRKRGYVSPRPRRHRWDPKSTLASARVLFLFLGAVAMAEGIGRRRIDLFALRVASVLYALRDLASSW